MSPKLMIASSAMIIAAILYTVAVFAARRSGRITAAQLVMHWLGFFLDLFGTILMASFSPGFGMSFHGVVGAIALSMRLIHAIWATWVYFKGDEPALERFNKSGIFVWLIWMVAFVTGLYLGMF